jgi:hypothetical protein
MAAGATCRQQVRVKEGTPITSRLPNVASASDTIKDSSSVSTHFKHTCNPDLESFLNTSIVHSIHNRRQSMQ